MLWNQVINMEAEEQNGKQKSGEKEQEDYHFW